MVISDTSITSDIDYKFGGPQDCLLISSFVGGTNRTQHSHFTHSYAFMIAN